MSNILLLGGGGFIGGHLGKKLKEDGHYVRIVDLKHNEYFPKELICNDYVVNDLRNQDFVNRVFVIEKNNPFILDYSYHKRPFTDEFTFDVVYQLAADMGGAGYIFTGDNDADIMYNSAIINLNVLNAAKTHGVPKIFYSFVLELFLVLKK